MDDQAIFDQLRTLTDEEHQIRQQGPEGDPARLEDIEVMLDQCWDLLRQRRAKRQYGEDPSEDHVRSETVVEFNVAEVDYRVDFTVLFDPKGSFPEALRVGFELPDGTKIRDNQVIAHQIPGASAGGACGR